MGEKACLALESSAGETGQADRRTATCGTGRELHTRE